MLCDKAVNSLTGRSVFDCRSPAAERRPVSIASMGGDPEEGDAKEGDANEGEGVIDLLSRMVAVWT
jgi:hypothetical protein